MSEPCIDTPLAPELPGTLSSSKGFKQEELFPIREVARLTGVNPVTLRAWERRYGLVQPTRTDSGHRLYSQADIDEVRSILGWIERGVAVSKVGKILARQGQSKVVSAPLHDDPSVGDWFEWQAQLRRAISAFDERRLEQLYGQIFSSYPLPVVFQDILMPVWQQLLLRQEQFGSTSEWLFLDSFLRARTLQRLQMLGGNAEERVLLAALPGQDRELELLVAALLLGSADIAVSVLAIGQPLDELTLVCEKTQPAALVVFSNHPPGAELPRRLARLARSLECSLLLAGEASHLSEAALLGSPIACLGNDGPTMQRRLQQFLAGALDT